jgi:hypothetical protein
MDEMDTKRCPVCPELLGALEAIVEDVWIEDQALLYRAEAAIAKATGQEVMPVK